MVSSIVRITLGYDSLKRKSRLYRSRVEGISSRIGEDDGRWLEPAHVCITDLERRIYPTKLGFSRSSHMRPSSLLNGGFFFNFDYCWHDTSVVVLF